MSNEPALVTTITAAAAAVVAVLVSFGADLSQEQTAALLGLVGVVAPVVAGIITRARVTPVRSPLDRS